MRQVKSSRTKAIPFVSNMFALVCLCLCLESLLACGASSSVINTRGDAPPWDVAPAAAAAAAGGTAGGYFRSSEIRKPQQQIVLKKATHTKTSTPPS